MGRGVQGNSYPILTKDRHVNTFLVFAQGMRFRLTSIGCGLAGYKPSDILPMFAHAPPNVIKPEEFCCIEGLIDAQRVSAV